MKTSSAIQAVIVAGAAAIVLAACAASPEKQPTETTLSAVEEEKTVDEESTATVITSEEELRAHVVGKPFASGDYHFIVNADGTIGGKWDTATTRRGVTGEWTFEDGYFCRRVQIGAKAYPHDCQIVEVTTDTVTFVRERGSGKRAEYRFE